MIFIKNSLSEQYNAIVDNLKISLIKKSCNPDKLTLNDQPEKLSDRYAHIINMKNTKTRKRRD